MLGRWRLLLLACASMTKLEMKTQKQDLVWVHLAWPGSLGGPCTETGTRPAKGNPRILARLDSSSPVSSVAEPLRMLSRHAGKGLARGKERHLLHRARFGISSQNDSRSPILEILGIGFGNFRHPEDDDNDDDDRRRKCRNCRRNMCRRRGRGGRSWVSGSRRP